MKKGILPAIFLLLSVLVASAASSEKSAESILAEAERLIVTGQKGSMEAVDLLELRASDFRGDIRFPLLLAEAWYRAADPEADIEEAYPFYEKAQRYSKEVLDREPENLKARYWYGLTQLKKAQKRGGVGAYFNTRRAIRDLEHVFQKYPAYDEAGAARVLSLLYRVAPQWSPFGDIRKSVEYGREAVRIAPGSPLNHLYLARSYLQAKNRQDAIEHLKAILALAPNPFTDEARKQLRELETPEGSRP